MYNDFRYDGWGWGYGYDGWNRNAIVRGEVDFCGACEDGKIGCANSTYHNNTLLGSRCRPVLFTKLEKRCINGKEIDILVSDREFFNRLRFDGTLCREFFASICTCIEFGDTRPVFISDNKCERLLPLETSRNGYLIHADQIQPFSDSLRLVKMTACFDPCNNHVTISNYFRKHVKCDPFCHEEKEDCGCGCGCGSFEGYNGQDDYNGYDGAIVY